MPSWVESEYSDEEGFEHPRRLGVANLLDEAERPIPDGRPRRLVEGGIGLEPRDGLPLFGENCCPDTAAEFIEIGHLSPVPQCGTG